MSSDRTPPVFTARPQRWSSVDEIVAKLVSLLAEAPDAPGKAAIWEELRRALKSGQIRHKFDLGTDIIRSPILAGLPRDPMDERVLLRDDLWQFVNRHGKFEHPDDAGSRWVKVCDEDALNHFRGWLRRQPAIAPEQSTEPAHATIDDEIEQPKVPAAVTPHPRRNYTPSDAKLVDIMHKAITRKRKPAKDATDAARRVVKMAEGDGTEDSTVKRLVARYYKIHPRLKKA